MAHLVRLKSSLKSWDPQQAAQTGQTILLAGLESYAVLFGELGPA